MPMASRMAGPSLFLYVYTCVYMYIVWVVVKIMVPFWVLSVVQKETIILTTIYTYM